MCWRLGTRRPVCLSPRLWAHVLRPLLWPHTGASLTDELGLRCSPWSVLSRVGLASESWGKPGSRGAWVLRARRPATRVPSPVEGRSVPARDAPPFGRNVQVWAHGQTLWRASAPQAPQPRVCLQCGLPLLAPGTPESCQILRFARQGAGRWERQSHTVGHSGHLWDLGPDSPGTRAAAPSAVLWPHPPNSADCPLAEGLSWTGPCWRHQAGMGASRPVPGFLNASRPRPGLPLTLEPESPWAGPLGHLQEGALGSPTGLCWGPPGGVSPLWCGSRVIWPRRAGLSTVDMAAVPGRFGQRPEGTG